MKTKVSKLTAALLTTCIGLSVFCLCGCDRKTPSTEDASALQGRLKAAKLITSSTEKNAALEELAKIASKAGHGQIVVQAISAINQSSTRNSAAESAAPLLAKTGEVDDAIAVVKLISHTSIRNKVLAEIATQE